MGYRKIPYAAEQGNSCAEQGIGIAEQGISLSITTCAAGAIKRDADHRPSIAANGIQVPLINAEHRQPARQTFL
jgi:hypothetical protein